MRCRRSSGWWVFRENLVIFANMKLLHAGSPHDLQKRHSTASHHPQPFLSIPNHQPTTHPTTSTPTPTPQPKPTHPSTLNTSSVALSASLYCSKFGRGTFIPTVSPSLEAQKFRTWLRASCTSTKRAGGAACVSETGRRVGVRVSVREVARERRICGWLFC